LEFDPVVGDGEPVLTATGLAVPGRLAPVDLTVRAGDRIMVSGDNGAGKTTLLTALSGLDARVPVGLLPQTHDDLRRATTMLDFFRSRVPMYAEDAEATLAGYLFDEDQWGQPLRTLSAGELRRLLLATIVNSGAQLLLLDEPTNYLDFDCLDVVETALRQYRGTLVMVTHDGYFAKAVGVTRHWHVTRGGTGSGTAARVVEIQDRGPAENVTGRTSTAL
jgi:ATP-binding cassette subfamily F protein 3